MLKYLLGVVWHCSTRAPALVLDMISTQQIVKFDVVGYSVKTLDFSTDTVLPLIPRRQGLVKEFTCDKVTFTSEILNQVISKSKLPRHARQIAEKLFVCCVALTSTPAEEAWLHC